MQKCNKIHNIITGIGLVDQVYCRCNFLLIVAAGAYYPFITVKSTPNQNNEKIITNNVLADRNISM